MPFVANSDADRAAMLAQIGVSRIEELFSDIPKDKRFPPLDLPPPLSELEVLRELEGLASRNATPASGAWFLGAGAYNHFIPSVVPAIASRGEFLTAYTPYQPEVSQGTLQAIFEYQSMAAELLGVEVVNASHYDGATALAEAVLMAYHQAPSRKVLMLPRDLHPHYLGVIRTYLEAFPVEVRTYSGGAYPESLRPSEEVFAVVAAYPTFQGEVHDLKALAEGAHAAGALFIVQTDPLMCAILKSPGSYGADIVVAEGQCLGNAMNFGGPYLGMMGASGKLLRKMPGRIVGEAKDHEGRRGFVLTLSAREQHIRREKAVSNICSNQGLVMLQACVYLAAMGKGGLATVAKLCWDKAHYAAETLGRIPGCKVLNSTFFKEFSLQVPGKAEALAARLEAQGIVPGLPLSRLDPGAEGTLLVCVTEMNTKAEIDSFAAALREALK